MSPMAVWDTFGVFVQADAGVFFLFFLRPEEELCNSVAGPLSRRQSLQLAGCLWQLIMPAAGGVFFFFLILLYF